MDERSTVLDLVSTRENDIVEFKEQSYSKSAKHEFLKDLTALANASGGTILIGVREDRTTNENILIGVADAQKEVNRLENWAINSVDPPVKELSIFQTTVLDDIVIVAVDVPDGPDKPYGIPHEEGHQFFVRVGSHCHRMSRSQLETCFKKARRDPRRIEAEMLRGEFLAAAREYRDFEICYAQGEHEVEAIWTQAFDQSRPDEYLHAVHGVTRRKPYFAPYTEEAAALAKGLDDHWVCTAEGHGPVSIRHPGVRGSMTMRYSDNHAYSELKQLATRAALIVRDCANFAGTAFPHVRHLDWHDGTIDLWLAMLVEHDIHRRKTFSFSGHPFQARHAAFDPETDPFYIRFDSNPFFLSAVLLEVFIEWLK